jgi:hypothetical protein
MTDEPMTAAVWGFIDPETGDFVGVTEEGMRRRWGAEALAAVERRAVRDVRDAVHLSWPDGSSHTLNGCDAMQDAVEAALRAAIEAERKKATP